MNHKSMIESVEIRDAHIVAAVISSQSKAGFSRAGIVAGIVVQGERPTLSVAADDSDRILIQVQAYISDQILGTRLTDEQLQMLLESGQAVTMETDCKAVHGAAVWALRRRLTRRNQAMKDLHDASVLVYSPIPGPDGSWLCVVKENSPRAQGLRDRWRDEAMLKAEQYVRLKDWANAEIEAEFAYQFSRGLEPETIALLSLTHEKRDRGARARGLLDMARNSRGANFETKVRSALQRLKLKLDVSR